MVAKAPKVTKADLQRVADMLQSLGMKPEEIEILPGRVRILTSRGSISLDEGADLDEELRKHRELHGYT